MTGRLDGKVAIITGGARGIGLAYAERFVAEGASVLVADHDDATGKDAAASLGGPDVAAFAHTDVAVPRVGRRRAPGPSSDVFGRVDVLVNNAALYGDWNMADQSFEYLQEHVFDVNLHGVWLIRHAVAPHMVAQGSSGG